MLNLYTLRIPCLLIFLIALSLDVFPQSRNKNAVSSEYQALSKMKGADMTVYDLYKEYRSKDTDKAAEYAEIFLKKADGKLTSPLVFDMEQFLSSEYENKRGQFSQALVLARRALKGYRQAGDSVSVAKTLLRIGRLYIRKERLDSAFIVTHRALSMLDDSDYPSLIEGNKLLGMVFRGASDVELSRRYFQECVRLARESGDSVRVAGSLANSSALSFLAGNDIRKARMLLEEAAKMAVKKKDLANLPHIYLNLAGLAVTEKDFDTTDRYLAKAAALCKTIEQRGLLSKIRAQKHILQGNSAAAVEELVNTEAIYREGEFPSELKDIYATLAWLHSSLGNAREALDYTQKRDSIDDMLDLNKVYINLFNLQKDYEVAAVEKDEGRKRTMATIWSVTGGVLLALILSAGAFLFFKSRCRRQLCADKTEMQRRNIDDISNFRKDTLIKEVIEKINRTISETRVARTKNSLQEINAMLEQFTDGRTLKEIENYVPGFNSDLYRKLIKDFPNLTPNESRICVLVAMNMTTKQISDITSQSVDAINMSRTRLRRKLGITGKNVGLQEFLNQYR